jgi:hypothetical protein
MKHIASITPETIICRNDKKFLANALGDEMVMMNMQTGDFISMNRVGADIWNLSQMPIQIGALVQQLLSMYEIDEARCKAETMQFIESTMAQELFIFTNTGD